MVRKFAPPWVVACLAMLVAGAAHAQTGTVAGLVVDRSTGEAIAAAQVTVMGTNIGTLTQENGRFLLQNVPAGNQVIRVERVGLTTVEREVTVTAGQTQDITIRLNSQAIPLQEIVVTGVSGATQRAKVPFEVAQINTDDVPVPVVSAAQAIQGKVAGATVVSGSGRPGSTPDILLRGATSLDASGRDQDPLYIVDGVILASGMGDIDALDIESIEIVKGAAAASLYGSRAANGVIQVTTKRGKSMPDNVVRYTARAEYGQSSLATDNEFLLTERHQFKMVNGQFVNSDGSLCDWLECASPVLAGQPGPDGTFGTADDVTGTAWNTYQEQAWPGQTFNQVEEFFQGGQFMQNYLSAEGRSGATNFHVSMSNTQDAGVMPGQDGYNRTNFRLNVDQAVIDGLQISGSAFYSRSSQDDTEGELFDLTRMPAGVDLRSEDPFDGNDDGVTSGPEELVLNVDPVNNESPNPLYAMLVEEHNTNRGRFLGSGNIRFSPLSWLDLDANASYDRLDSSDEDYYPKGYRTISPSSTLNEGNLSQGRTTREALNASVTGTMRFQLTPDIANRTQLRYLYEDQDYLRVSTGGNTFAVADVPVIGALDQSTVTGFSENRTIRADGYFAITNFEFMERYIIDALIRNDGSSLFGEDERRQTYYRIAGAWRVAEEPWFALDAVDELKLRYSLGTAGGRPNFYAQYETYSVGGGRVSPVALGNKELKPEHSTEQEVGVDASFFQGRLVAGLTYANTVTRDQLLQVPLPAYSGFINQWRNAGTLEGNTYELSLQAGLLRTDNLDWSARLIWDRTRTTITELNVPPFAYGVGGQGLGTVFYARPGEELGNFYGVQYARSCADLPVDMSCDGFEVNDDGWLVWTGTDPDNTWGTSSSSEDVTVRGSGVSYGTPFAGECTDRSTEERTLFCHVGNSIPDFNLGLSSSLTWRGLSIYGLVDAVQGFDVYNQPLQWGTFKRYTGIMDQTGVPEDSKKPVGYYDALYGVSGLQPSNVFVEDGSFVKLREVSVSYRLGAEQLSSIPLARRFRGMGISLTGRNLLTFTDYRGYDPEVGEGGGNTGSAALARVDGYNYPNFRTWTAAIELVF